MWIFPTLWTLLPKENFFFNSYMFSIIVLLLLFCYCYYCNITITDIFCINISLGCYNSFRQNLLRTQTCKHHSDSLPVLLSCPHPPRDLTDQPAYSTQSSPSHCRSQGQGCCIPPLLPVLQIHSRSTCKVVSEYSGFSLLPMAQKNAINTRIIFLRFLFSLTWEWLHRAPRQRLLERA